MAGTKFHYTTHGWTLLSAVVEKVSGQPFLDYLHSHVLSPLGMTSTGPERHDPLTTELGTSRLLPLPLLMAIYNYVVCV